MSVGAIGGATPLPEPGGPASTPRDDTERAALAFERMLLVQLTEQLSKSAQSEDASSAATTAYRDLMPGALADALVAGGGIGLAAQLTKDVG